MYCTTFHTGHFQSSGRYMNNQEETDAATSLMYCTPFHTGHTQSNARLILSQGASAVVMQCSFWTEPGTFSILNTGQKKINRRLMLRCESSVSLLNSTPYHNGCKQNNEKNCCSIWVNLCYLSVPFWIVMYVPISTVVRSKVMGD